MFASGIATATLVAITSIRLPVDPYWTIVELRNEGPDLRSNVTLMYDPLSPNGTDAVEHAPLGGLLIESGKSRTIVPIDAPSPCPKVSRCFLRFEFAADIPHADSGFIDGLGMLENLGPASGINISYTRALHEQDVIEILFENAGPPTECDISLLTDLDSGDVSNARDLGKIGTQKIEAGTSDMKISIGEATPCPADSLCCFKCHNNSRGWSLYSNVLTGLGRLAIPENKSFLHIIDVEVVERPPLLEIEEERIAKALRIFLFSEGIPTNATFELKSTNTSVSRDLEVWSGQAFALFPVSFLPGSSQDVDIATKCGPESPCVLEVTPHIGRDVPARLEGIVIPPKAPQPEPKSFSGSLTWSPFLLLAMVAMTL